MPNPEEVVVGEEQKPGTTVEQPNPAGEGGGEQKPAEPEGDDLVKQIADLQREQSKMSAFNARERKRNAQLEQEIAALKARQPGPVELSEYEKELALIADDDFIAASMIKKILPAALKAERERILSQMQESIPAVERRILSNLSLKAARKAHPDFDEMRDTVLKNNITEDDAREITESDDPAETAYEIALRYRDKANQGGNPAGAGGAATPKPKPTQLRGTPGTGKTFSAAEIESKIANWEKLSVAEKQEILKITST